MTRGTAKSKVHLNLDNHNYFSEADLNDSLQAAYDEIATATGCIEGVFELTLVPNQMYYRMTDLIPNYFHTVRIFSPYLDCYLEETDSRALDRIRRDWELWRDNPFYWFPHSYDRIGIVPALRENPYKVIVFYKAKASQMVVDGDAFNVPLEAQYLPENFGTADLLEQAQEFTKAGIFQEQYQMDLKKTLKLMNRGLPDQLVRLEG